jgi:hypothetical protein
MGRGNVRRTQGALARRRRRNELESRGPQQSRLDVVASEGVSMDALGWLIVVLVIVVLAAVAFGLFRRWRRGGGVIATKDKP